MSESLRAHLERRPWLASLALAVAFLPVKLYGSDCSYLNMHAARDWERGWQMLHGVEAWWNGPELLFRGAIPGFFFNALAGLFQLPTRNPIFASMGTGILFCAAIFFFHEGMRLIFSRRTALWATLIFGAQPLGTIVLRYLWNPSYLFVFSAIALWCVARAIKEKRGGWMAGALMSTLLAAQLHLSAFSAVAAVVIIAIRCRLFPRWWQLGAVLLVYAAFVAPYFVSQYAAGWPDRAAVRETELDPQITVMRFFPNWKFLPPFGLQFFVQYLGYPQTFPFSYYERFYQARRLFKYLGLASFFATVPFLLLAIGGSVAALKRPFSAKLSSDRSLYLQSALIYITVCCIPQVLWNPRAQGIFANDFGVPIRYLLIFWPSQFILMGGAVDWLLSKKSATSRLVELWLAGAVFLCVLVTFLFNMQSRKTGEPFNYLFFPNQPVHALRDKFATAKHLVDRWGVDDALLQTRVHTQGTMMTETEESMDYEIHAALEDNPGHPIADTTIFYFLCESRDLDRVSGDAEILEKKAFGGIGLTVYRPRQDLTRWKVDAPLSWWWY